MRWIIVAVLAVVIAAVLFMRWRTATAEIQAAVQRQQATERQINALDAQRRDLEAQIQAAGERTRATERAVNALDAQRVDLEAAVARLVRFEGVADADAERSA